MFIYYASPEGFSPWFWAAVLVSLWLFLNFLTLWIFFFSNPNPVLISNFLPRFYIHTLTYKLILLFSGMYPTVYQSLNSV